MSDDRVDFLNEINSFVIESKSYLSDLLSKINWTEDNLPSGSGSDRSLGEQSTSSDFHSDTQINYNLKEYNGEINKVCSGIVDVLPQPLKKDKEETLLEILARERNLKRRRIGYKGRIHTKHKSHHEILREVIAQQMEAIEDTISGDVSTCSNQIDDQTNSTKEESVKIIDVSQMNVCNPHLTWKYVVNHLKQIEHKENPEKYSQGKRSRSKSRIHNDEDSKSDKSYRKRTKDNYYEDMLRSNIDISYREKKDTSYRNSKSSSKDKLKSSSKSKIYHEKLDRNHSDEYWRKSDKDHRNLDISHYDENRFIDNSKGKSCRIDCQKENDRNKDDSCFSSSNNDFYLDKGLSNFSHKEEYWESNDEDNSKIYHSRDKKNQGRCKEDREKSIAVRNTGKEDHNNSKGDRYIITSKRDHDRSKRDHDRSKRDHDRSKRDHDGSKEDRYMDSSNVDRIKRDHDEGNKYWDECKEDHYVDRSKKDHNEYKEISDRRIEDQCIDRSKNQKDRDKSKKDGYMDRSKVDCDRIEENGYMDKSNKYCYKTKEDCDRSNEDRCIDRSKNQKDHDKSKEDRFMVRSKKDRDKTEEDCDISNKDRYRVKSQNHYQNKQKESSHYKNSLDDSCTNEIYSDETIEEFNSISELDKKKDISQDKFSYSDMKFESYDKIRAVDEIPSKSKKKKKEDRHPKKSKKHRRSRDKSGERSEKSKKKKKKRSGSQEKLKI